MSSQDQPAGGDSVTAKVSGGVMLALVFVLFLVIVFVFFFYLYARRRMGRSARFVFAAEHVAPHPGRGLDAAVLRSLPVTMYRPADYKEGIECAVCLTDLAEGDEVRLLPKCSHGFHLACIDMWFRSHTTCPLCRAPVGPQPTASAQSSHETEESAGGPPNSESVSDPPAFPSGVLFWGSEDQVNVGNSRHGPSSYASSSGSKMPAGGALVIDIQSRTPEGAPSPMSPSKPTAEEAKSPASTSRFKSLTRLLSLGKRAAGPSQSPSGVDVEQGHGGSTTIPRVPSDS